MIDASRIFAGLPVTLRDELLKCYQQIITNYAERRWEPAELNGGKFCEVVYSIVDGAIRGTFPAQAGKPANMLAACQALERTPSNPSRVGDRSLRILIPRLLPILYEIRNNRGVGHVGGDVDPNHMDAEAVQAMASWVMAELVRILHGLTTAEAQVTVDGLVERKSPLIWEIEGVKRVLDPKMNFKDKSLLLLYQVNGWVDTSELLNWVEYSNPSAYRRKLLTSLHNDRLIEFAVAKDRARISPLGRQHVETLLRKALGVE